MFSYQVSGGFGSGFVAAYTQACDRYYDQAKNNRREVIHNTVININMPASADTSVLKDLNLTLFSSKEIDIEMAIMDIFKD